jgi:hypothetical protein
VDFIGGLLMPCFMSCAGETGITTDDFGLKVNNNYTALASRDLMTQYPELDGMFAIRQRKSK